MNDSYAHCLGSSFRVVETTAASLSLVLNALLCTIILLNRSKELRAYSRVLLCNAFVDTFFTLSSFIVEIHPDVRGGIFFVVNDGIRIQNYEINLYLFCLYLFSVYFAIAIVAVPMVCRYLAVCRNRQVGCLHLSGLFFAAALASGTVPLTTYLYWLPASYRTIQERAHVISALPCHDRSEMPLFPLEDVLSLTIGSVFLSATCVVGLTYCTVVFCALNVRRTVASSSTLSRKSLHRQLNFALLVQAVNPLFVIVLPISGMFLVVVCGVEELNTVVQVCTSFLSWIPVINPLSAIYFIKSYRMELMSLLSACRNCQFVIRSFTSHSSFDRESQLARTQKANTSSTKTANATSRSNTVQPAPQFSPLEG